MTDLPRYYVDGISCLAVDPNGSWMRVEDVSARLQQLAQEKATLLKDMSKLACSYCDNVIEFDSPEARWTDEGRARAFEHMLECPNRPELKLIERIETLSAALAETRDALHQLQEKYDALTRSETREIGDRLQSAASADAGHQGDSAGTK